MLRHPAPEESSLRAERRVAVRAALGRLKAKEAEVLSAWAAGELYDRAPTESGMSVNQAYRLTSRAKVKLREMLRKVLE